MTPGLHYTTVSATGIGLLHKWESCRLDAYLDGGGVWTIGWGTVKYPDSGLRVKKGDTCTQEQADTWFRADLRRTEQAVDALTLDDVLQRQFDALCCLTYNIGEGGYRGSTVRKLVNLEPANYPAIRAAWMRWHFDNGKPVKGLWNRRHAEADFYEGVTTECPALPYPQGDA